jgi:hypothetical protein
MPNEPDYIVDFGQAGDSAHPNVRHNDRNRSNLDRPWLAVRWQCCGTYSRIYRNQKATSYDGHCPKCGRPVHIKIAPGGTSARFFDAW